MQAKRAGVSLNKIITTATKHTPPTFNKFKILLDKAKTEEDVKGAFAKQFDIDYQTSARHNLYTPQVFFEFKIGLADKNEPIK